MNKRIVVTGASGFIGRQTLEPLLLAGFEVHAVARQPLELKNIIWHRCDLLDADESSRLIKTIKPSHLLHCAWYVEHGKFWDSPLNLDWTAASLLLARHFVDCGGERFVGVGSCTEYDWTRHDKHLWKETDPLKPSTLYGVSKMGLFQILTAYFATVGCSFAWSRIFYLFGPHEPKTRLLPAICHALIQDKEFNYSNSSQVKDYLPVSSVAQALAAIVASKATDAINVAAGQGISIPDFVQRVAHLLRKDHLIKPAPTPAENNEPDIVGETTRLTTEVGFTIPRDFDQQLATAVQWWMAFFKKKSDK